MSENQLRKVAYVNVGREGKGKEEGGGEII